MLALAGVALAALLLLRFDARQVFGAAIAVGWHGFALLLVWQGLLFVLLGLAWMRVLPDVRLGVLVWGRMVRDAATTCLPFSPVGGFVLGARAVGLHGAPWPTAAAGTVVDVTAEIMAQLLFALFGVLVLVVDRPGSVVVRPVVIMLGVALVGALAIYGGRRGIGRALQRLGGRLLGDWFRTQGGLEQLRAELGRLYASPGRLLQATTLHLAGWVATGVGTWISVRLLGHSAELIGIVALEALLDMVIAAAFVVPAAAGVQEAGLVGLGAAFGVPPEVALSVSLLRRAKDLAWGLPVLGVWQWQEMRRL